MPTAILSMPNEMGLSVIFFRLIGGLTGKLLDLIHQPLQFPLYCYILEPDKAYCNREFQSGLSCCQDYLKAIDLIALRVT